MKMSIIRAAAWAAATAGLVAGCSSAPEAGQQETSSDSLTSINRGGIVPLPNPVPLPPIDVCPMLPLVRNEPPPSQHNCLPNVRGYNVAVPSSVTSCPSLWLNDINVYWPPTNATPGAAQDPAPWDDPNAGVHANQVCSYEFRSAWAFSRIPSGRWVWVPNVGQIPSAELCQSTLTYTAITYILPKHENTQTLPTYSPQGVTLPPLPVDLDGTYKSCLPEPSQSRSARPIDPTAGCDVCIVKPGGGAGARL